MASLAVFVFFILVIGFFGSVCYEWTERTDDFWPKALLRTLSWFWIGVAGLLLSLLIKIVVV